METRVLVVSHACVIPENQSVYAHLAALMDVTIVAPATWRDALRAAPYPSERLPAFTGHWMRVRTLGRGRPQRHLSLLRPARLLRERRPDMVLIEEEPFSLQAWWWARAARRRGIPYAVQVAENLPREFPWVVRRWSAKVLGGASFLLARSPRALEQARQWGYRGPSTVVPHGVDLPDHPVASLPTGVLGFVGRLVAEKGVTDVTALVRDDEALTLLVAGDGPLRGHLEALGPRARMLGTLPAGEMAALYAHVTLVVVPSRTTPTWSEQFGRVIVEAQSYGVPVIAYDSGEIPWVASLTSVVLVVEGDENALREEVRRLAHDPTRAASLGAAGREGVERHFTNEAIAKNLADLVRSR